MRLILGDCVAMMRELDECSVDAVVTDPPGGISLLGLSWDSDRGGRSKWVSWMTTAMRECLRVARPGAYAVVWSMPRTSHWTGTAIEQSGWEIKNVITHVFTSGFPKSREQLKPAVEFWWLAKKPGPGALNIADNTVGDGQRWPANYFVSHSETCELVGTRTISGRQMNRYLDGPKPFGGGAGLPHQSFTMPDEVVEVWDCHPDCVVGDQGIYFNVSKPSVSEQEAGLDGPNPHPACKSIGLMRSLVRLVAPSDGVVLDIFLGSGTTGIASVLENRSFVGIEENPEYLRVAEARIAYWTQYGEDGWRIASEREAAETRRERVKESGQMDLMELL